MTALPASIIAHYRRGEYAEADEICSALLQAQPENAAAWHMRGVLALNRKDFAAAAGFLSCATASQSADTETYTNLGMALLGAGRLEEAVDALRKAISLDADCAEAHLYLARCKLCQADLEEGERAIEDALTIRPSWPEALEVKAAVLLRRGKTEEADALARAVIQREPDRSDAYRIMAEVCARDERHQEAIDHLRAALERDPGNVEAMSSLALLLSRLGRHEKAMMIGRKALNLEPGNPSARYNLALTLLTLGQLEEGWQCYRARLDRPDNFLAKRPFAAAPTTARPTRGARVFAWTDQGVGEQIMFANLVPDLIATGASIGLECEQRLVSLFQRSFPDVEILPRTSPPHPRLTDASDGQFCLPDAAGWFRNSFGSFPKHRGYLTPDRKLSAQLRARYGVGKPLIGISWRTAHQAKISRGKTLPLPEWGPLLKVPGVTFVNLQYGATRDEVTIVELATGVRIISDPDIDSLLDLDTFAAQVSAMDLVITTSNTTAHMAGALGVPAWTFVPFGVGGLWHWFLDRSDSPWYPSMRLFRQPKSGKWSHVVNDATTSLAELVSQR